MILLFLVSIGDIITNESFFFFNYPVTLVQHYLNIVLNTRNFILRVCSGDKIKKNILLNKVIIFGIILFFVGNGVITSKSINPDKKSFEMNLVTKADRDFSPPTITINLAGNQSDSGGPYWAVVTHPPPWEEGIHAWPGYYTNDSKQHEDCFTLGVNVIGRSIRIISQRTVLRC